MRPETLAIRTQTERTAQKEHATPLFLTSSFVYDSAEDMAAAFADDSLDVKFILGFLILLLMSLFKRSAC
ncbi:MAG: hypothetical protein RLZZ390_1344 [Bacteroidota bacterium]